MESDKHCHCERTDTDLALSVNLTLCWFSLNFFNHRIGLTLNRNKMQRCAGSCGGEQGTCEAERWGQTKTRTLQNCSRPLFRSYLQGKRTVIRMLGNSIQLFFGSRKYQQLFILVVVVFAFFFCWTPFHSQRVMFCLGKTLEKWRIRRSNFGNDCGNY